ncbi:atherin-like [Prionailurus viverrinus]|uniref:atherin-like n=1 Tax=Prionailurus viverrinus TaxID=61388 RepID=UPI001FF2D9B7|nr:atherin-like [Prionailurus viverrinus]
MSLTFSNSYQREGKEHPASCGGSGRRKELRPRQGAWGGGRARRGGVGRRAAPPREAVGAADGEAPAATGGPAPLPRPSHKGAQGPRFLLAPPGRPGPVGSAPLAAARAGLWAARLPRASSGLWRERGRVTRRPPAPAPARTRPPPPTPSLTPQSAPARPPPGRFRHAEAMASGRLLRLTAAPAPLLAEGKGAGAVRRRRRRPLQAKPPLFFPHPPPTPTPPAHTRKGFPDTLAEVPQFPETGRDHFRWGKSHLSGASRVALGPRPAERGGRGRSRVGAAALA